MIWVFYGFLFYWTLYYTPKMAADFMSAMAGDPQGKAMALFLSWCTPQQRKDYLKHDFFYCIGSKTKTEYRVRKANSPYNVDELRPDGTVKRKICFVPRGTALVGDVMLAQKIGLETDEDYCLEVANVQNFYYQYPA